MILRSRALAGNVGARVAGLLATFVATLVLAHDGGPALVGLYALLHVLPSLVGMVVSAGLALAATYLLAGPARTDRRLPLTIVAMTLGCGLAGTALWVVAAPTLGAAVLPDVSPTLVAVAGVLVLSRLVVTTAKACSQGTDDLPGANIVIAIEELNFLPAYAVLATTGMSPDATVVAALLAADAATASLAWARLARRGFFRGATRPAVELGRALAGYGLRAQAGFVIAQLNLRLDFVLLSALAGPAVLGVYAIASKFAELTRILSVAIGYVLYPELTRAGRARAIARARALLLPCGAATAATALLLGVAVGLVIPALYGAAFESAVTPARIILLGLAFDGVAAVLSALLLGIGQPGRNSLAMTAGLVVTVSVDLLLIPRYEAIGAAVASALAYLTTTLALLLFWRLAVRHPAGAGGRRVTQRAFSRAS